MFWAPENVNFEESYAILNGRVSVTPNDGDFTVSAWARNLTDELYRVNVIAFFGDEVSRLAAPRTYGVSAAVKF